MRHRRAGFKLGRDSEHRKILRRNLAISLFTHGQITTTIPKAKSVQPFVEKLISTARRGDLAARRRVIKAIGDPFMVVDDEDVERNRYGEVTSAPRVVKKLFEQIAPQYADRQGGYTRIIRLGKHRIGDGSQLCVLQLVGEQDGPQISGQYSRRRAKANNRMAFAAKIRKRDGEDETLQDEAETATAVADPDDGATLSNDAPPVEDAESAADEAPKSE